MRELWSRIVMLRACFAGSKGSPVKCRSHVSSKISVTSKGISLRVPVLSVV